MGNLRIVLLSGPFKVGKTTLTGELIESFGFRKISSSGYLRQLVPGIELMDEAASRRPLQEKGDQLDIETDYNWVVDPVAVNAIANFSENENWLFDAVRKPRQVEHFRARFSNAVTHVHLTAPEATLKARSQLTDAEYSRDISHPNEIAARSLDKIADLVVDTSLCTPQQIARLIASRKE